MVDALAEFSNGKWLLQKIFPGFQRQTRFERGGSVAAHQDVFEGGPDLNQPKNELIPKKAGHDNVTEHESDFVLLFLEESDRFVAGTGLNYFVTGRNQALAEKFTNGKVVIN